jgi:hypothetical protein
MKKIAILLLLIMSVSCAKQETTPTTNSPTQRWMDRKVYFAQSNGAFPLRNNEFQKAKVKEAFNDIAARTDLGSTYFQFEDVEEGLLSPIIETTTSAGEFKSFVLILPDEDFNDFVFNQLGGDTPDPNAVTIVNAAYKRKFFIIFRASCFSGGASCGTITSSFGVRALVARQLALLVGLTARDCDDFPNDVMCASSPKDTQWLPDQRDSWVANFNNQLEIIKLSPGFYDEALPSGN